MKVRGGVGEISLPSVEALPTIEAPNTFYGHPLRGCEHAGLIFKKLRKKKVHG